MVVGFCAMYRNYEDKIGSELSLLDATLPGPIFRLYNAWQCEHQRKKDYTDHVPRQLN